MTIFSPRNLYFIQRLNGRLSLHSTAVLVGELSNKGGRGQRNREEIGAGAT